MSALPIALAIIPALLLLWYFQSRDLHPEPPRVVWATFFLGIATIPGILMFALPLAHSLESIGDPYLFGLAEAFLCAALPEEFFKFLVLNRYSTRHREFNEPMDGIVYGVAVSLGFATLENILYVSDGGLSTALARALTAVPGHAFTGAIMGYYVGRARFTAPGEPSHLERALLVPVLLHGLYDFPLLSMERIHKLRPHSLDGGAEALLIGMALLVLLFEYRLALRLVRRLRREQDTSAGRAAAPTPLAAPTPTTTPTQPPLLLGWALLLLGGGLATGGGLLLLLVGIGLIVDSRPVDLLAMLLGSGLLGGLPLLVGLRLFRAGIARLNRATPPPPPRRPRELLLT